MTTWNQLKTIKLLKHWKLKLCSDISSQDACHVQLKILFLSYLKYCQQEKLKPCSNISIQSKRNHKIIFITLFQYHLTALTLSSEIENLVSSYYRKVVLTGNNLLINNNWINMNETNLNVYYTVQTIPQNLIKLMNCWNSSRSPTSTVLFLELVCRTEMQLKAVHSGMGSSLLDDASRGGGEPNIVLRVSLDWWDSYCWRSSAGRWS